MTKIIQRAIVIAVMTQVLVMVMAILTFQIGNDYLSGTFNGEKMAAPKNWLALLQHNLFYAGSLFLPWINLVFYVVAMLFTGLMIGLSAIQHGWEMTMMKLWHMPIEILGFALVLSLVREMWQSKRWMTVDNLKIMIIALTCLVIAATIEIQL